MVDGETRHDAAFLSQVLRDAPVPLWVIDPQGLVSLANRAATGFLGYRGGDELIGGPSHDLLHRHRPDGSPYPLHECPIMHPTGSGAASEWFVTRAGDIRPVRWSTQRVGVDGAMLLSFSAPDPADAGALRAATAAGSTGPGWGVRPSPTEMRARLRETMRRSIEARFTDPTFSTASLAKDARLSVRSVQAIFAEVESSPAAEVRRLRLEHARTLLEHGHPVQAAGQASGFLDPGTFARAYRQRFGFAPSRTRPSGARLELGDGAAGGPAAPAGGTGAAER